ncbi:MAG: ribbon-helix-helix domain-containing protein [Candidatus Heimdallarchaeaceae archaeon]
MSPTDEISKVIRIKLVTVHLPSEFLNSLDELVRQKRYPNRSEIIRVAIRDLLKEEFWGQQKNVYNGSMKDNAY